MKLTDTKIAALKPRPNRYEVWDARGLGIRITSKGRKSWVFVYHFAGRPRRMTFGAFPAIKVTQAHKLHSAAVEQLESGIDPGAKLVDQRHTDRRAPTIDWLIDQYLTTWAEPRKKSWAEDRRILRKDVSPAWGKRKAKDIHRRDVIALLDSIVNRGAPISANRTLEIVRKMFNFAIERDILEHNPCTRVRAPGKKSSRDRVLTRKEVRTFWKHLRTAQMDDNTKLALKLLLVTGQRRAEVASMEWSELDLDAGWWEIPASKSKNGLKHRVHLSTLARTILRRAKKSQTSSLFVFPSPRRNHGDLAIRPQALSRAVTKNREHFGIDRFTPHDLRRTAASNMGSLGVPRLVIAKILNHVDSGVTSVYDRHSYDAEKQGALDRWGARLMSYLRGRNNA